MGFLSCRLARGHVVLARRLFNRADLRANPLDFIVKFLHFLEVANFVNVSLVLKILPFLLRHVLPATAHVLHNDEGAHVRVLLHNFEAGLWSTVSEVKHLLL